MKICVVGTGYVGLVTGACFADMGNDVLCVDVDAEKIATLRGGEVPFYEPGLEELVNRNAEQGRLGFTTDIGEGVAHGKAIFIAVGTPEGEDGFADLQYVLQVATQIGEVIDGYRLVITKSTVPVGTAGRVEAAIRTALERRGVELAFDVASNPEFLKEGSAVGDFMKPDRVVIGADTPRARETLEELYGSFMLKSSRVIAMDVRSAEMTKYASNAMLATKISFINEIANICEAVGADVGRVRAGMCADKRIGTEFLFPGIGYGGSCFPKDVKALVNIAHNHGYETRMLSSVDEVNKRQKLQLALKVLRHFEARGIAPEQAKVAVWGLAFKPNTDDVRQAPAITIIRRLLEAGVTVAAFDPVAATTARTALGDAPGLTICGDEFDALEGAHALAVCTEWGQFRLPDFDRMKELMAEPVIFDGRNIYEPERIRGRGFTYYGIGRPA